MTTAAELILKAKAVRQRLMNPPNAVRSIDNGGGGRGSEKSPMEVLEYRLKRAEQRLLGIEIRYQNLEEEVGLLRLAADEMLEYIHGPDATGRLKLNRILRIVSRYYGVPLGDIKSARRDKDIVIPRQVVCYLSAKHTGLSLPSIGRCLGNRDHTTIMSARDRVIERVASDPLVRQDVAALEKEIVDDYYTSLALAPESEPHLAAPGEPGVPEREVPIMANGGGVGGEGVEGREDKGDVCGLDQPLPPGQQGN